MKQAAVIPAFSLILILAFFSCLYVTFRPTISQPEYYNGDYNVSLNLYSFNVNINSWVKNRTNGAPALDTITAIKWAKQAGFNSVNIPMYYVIGYEGTAMPSQPVEKIRAFMHEIKQTAAELGLMISGTGIGNNFAHPDPAFVKLEVERSYFWIDMAAEMGAPFMRVFSGPVPADIDSSGGWEAVVKNRLVPALKNITAYAATKHVKIGLQNHGDMTATAEQTIQMMQWVDNPNILLVDDTGYFRPFKAPNGTNYDWYADINKCLPHSVDLQVKIKPAGPEQHVLMDYYRLFTGLRSSPYHEFVNLERLWAKDGSEPDHPDNMTAPPFAVVLDFYEQVKVALEATKEKPWWQWWK